MQTLQFFAVCKQNKFVFRPWGCNIDQFRIVFQPLLGTDIGAVGQCRGKKHHMLFISLKSMHRSTD